MSLENFISDKKIISCKSDDSICDVAKKMKDHDIGCVVIENNNGKPEGVVTDRDFTKATKQPLEK